MVVLIFIGALLVCSLAGGWQTYRRTLGREPYSGTMGGALRLASVLGFFLGTSIALATLLAVLAVREAR
jgi:hypothetical protein